MNHFFTFYDDLWKISTADAVSLIFDANKSEVGQLEDYSAKFIKNLDPKKQLREYQGQAVYNLNSVRSFKKFEEEVILKSVVRRVHVESSSIDSIGHNRESKLLEIKFKAGGIYHYADVPRSLFSRMIRAKSKGKFFHRNVRDVFEYAKVG